MAWLDQACFVGSDDGLRAVTAAEFHQDVADIGLDSGFAEEEPFGDLAVGQAPRDLDEDLGLSRGEVGQGGPRAFRRTPREFGDQPSGHRRGEQRVTPGNGCDAGDQRVGRGVFEQEPAGAGPVSASPDANAMRASLPGQRLRSARDTVEVLGGAPGNCGSARSISPASSFNRFDPVRATW